MKDSLKAFESAGLEPALQQRIRDQIRGDDEGRCAVRRDGPLLREGISDRRCDSKSTSLKSKAQAQSSTYNVRHVRVGHSCRGGPWHAARVGRRPSRCSRLAIAPSSSAASTSSTAHDRIDEIVIALPPDLASVAAALSDFIAKAGAHRRWRRAAAGFGGEGVRAGVEERRASSSFTTRRGRSRPPDSVYARHRGGGKRGRGDRGACRRSDTVKEATAAPGVRIVARTIARESIYLAQTPQAFSRDVLEDAIERGRGGVRTGDRRSVARRAGRPLGAAGGRRIDEHQDHDGTGSSRVESPARD